MLNVWNNEYLNISGEFLEGSKYDQNKSLLLKLRNGESLVHVGKGI